MLRATVRRAPEQNLHEFDSQDNVTSPTMTFGHIRRTISRSVGER